MLKNALVVRVKKIRDKIILFIQYITNKISNLHNDVGEIKQSTVLALKEIEKIREEIKYLSVTVNNLKKEKEMVIESIWRTYGYKYIDKEFILRDLYSAYSWEIQSPNYWMILFSSLINIGLSHVVSKFIPRYISIHGFNLIDRYLPVAKLVSETSLDYPSDIGVAAMIYCNFNDSRKKIHDYFSNKTVAIVGNGPSEIGSCNGNLIDGYDVVVRFNNYITEKFSTDYGNKTNVWIRGSAGDDIKDRDLLPYDLIIFEGDYDHFPVHFNDLTLINKYITINEIPCCNFDYETHLSLRERSGIDFPTTGLVAIWAILNIVGKENIGLFGFSFLEKKALFINDHYFNDREEEESKIRTSVHNMKKESDFISKYCV